MQNTAGAMLVQLHHQAGELHLNIQGCLNIYMHLLHIFNVNVTDCLQMCVTKLHSLEVVREAKDAIPRGIVPSAQCALLTKGGEGRMAKVNN